MAKQFGLTFGSGDPRTNTGLTPTFLLFYNFSSGATLTSPAVSETYVGSGIYNFSYEPTISIAFLADGGAALGSASRYVTGVLDPIQAVDERVGTTSDSFGSTSIDPTTVIGWLKRAQEFFEGDKNFAKSTGVWQISSRGASTLLRTKNLTDNVSSSSSSGS